MVLTVLQSDLATVASLPSANQRTLGSDISDSAAHPVPELGQSYLRSVHLTAPLHLKLRLCFEISIVFTIDRRNNRPPTTHIMHHSPHCRSVAQCSHFPLCAFSSNGP
jgi:hypothetical protein